MRKTIAAMRLVLCGYAVANENDGVPNQKRVEVGAVAKLLIDNGADVNVKGFANNTPLHMAALCARMRRL